MLRKWYERARLWPWLAAGLLLTAFGMRLILAAKLATPLPYCDEWEVLQWMTGVKEGTRDMGYVLQHHNQSFYAITPIVSWVLFHANGIYDARNEAVVGLIAWSVYAAALLAIFLRIAPKAGRPAILLTAVFVLLIPHAAKLVSWGYLLGYPLGMTCCLAAIGLASAVGQRWWLALPAVVFLALGSSSFGSACIAGPAVAAMHAAKFWRTKRLSLAELMVSVAGLVLFAVVFASTPKGGAMSGGISIAGILLTIMKMFSWPSTLTSPVGLLVPLAIGYYAFEWVRGRIPLTRGSLMLLGCGAFVVAQALAFSVFRHANIEAKGAVVPGQYIDILMLTPFTTAGVLLMLWEKRWRNIRPAPWVLGALLAAQFLNGSAVALFRILPILSGERIESSERGKTHWLRTLDREGVAAPVEFPQNVDPVVTLFDVRDHVWKWFLKDSTAADAALPRTSIVSHRLEPALAEGFAPDACHPGVALRADKSWWGSLVNDHQDSGKFVTAPFVPKGSYLSMEVSLDRTARMTGYRLSGMSLDLVDESTGARTPVLPILRRQFPSLLRDTESVCVPVIAGRQYRLEAADTVAGETNWFGFAEPADCGKLAPWIMGFLNSGRIVLLLGAALLGIAAVRSWIAVLRVGSDASPA